MSDITTLTGIVATTPRHLVTSSGLAITSFRLASSQRRFDRARNAWVDADTNWYTISSFRHLAFNVARSIHKGEHVLVTGRLRIRDWTSDERTGTSIEVEADAVGHDLLWCTTTCVRSAPSSPAAQPASQAVPGQPDLGQLDPGQPDPGRLDPGQQDPGRLEPGPELEDPGRDRSFDGADTDAADTDAADTDAADTPPEYPRESVGDGFLPEQAFGLAP